MNAPTPAPIDPCCCPLCGQPNQCAMEAARQTGQPVGVCWCVNLQFGPDLLARVPEAAHQKACICQRCAESSDHG
jgi:Cysteine-rich CWC